MECPKCKHQQQATDKCESCGVYFSKLGAKPAEPKPARAERKRAEEPQSKIGAGPFIATAVVTALVVIGFMRKGKDTPEVADNPAPSNQRIVIVEDPRL